MTRSSFLLGVMASVVTRGQTHPLSIEEYDEFVSSGWSPAVSSTDEGVVKQFGTPRRTTRKRVQNPHDEGQIDEIVGLEYAGLAVKFYKVPDKQIVVNVIVSDARMRLPYGLNVGARQDHILRVLGRPSSVTGGRLKFETKGIGYVCAVYFTVAQGIIRSIEWEGGVD